MRERLENGQFFLRVSFKSTPTSNTKRERERERERVMANQEKRKNEDDVIQPLAKAMANNEKRIRDKAVRNLRRWLSFN